MDPPISAISVLIIWNLNIDMYHKAHCTLRPLAAAGGRLWPRCSGGPKNGRQMPPGHAVAKSLRRTVGREYWWQKCRPVGALKTSWEKMSCHFSLINRRSGDI